MAQAEQSQADQGAAGISAFDALMWEILRFLWTCPNKGREHPYRFKYIRMIQEQVIEAIATGQYLLFRNPDGSIKHFMSYWLIEREDIENIRQGIKPVNRFKGPIIYICDHGNKGGRHSLTEMIKQLRQIPGNQGAIWHNWNSKKYRTSSHQREA